MRPYNEGLEGGHNQVCAKLRLDTALDMPPCTQVMAMEGRIGARLGLEEGVQRCHLDFSNEFAFAMDAYPAR